MQKETHNCLILVSGGARSGKSTFAEALAEEIAAAKQIRGKIAYIATGQVMDPEFAKRIEAHQRRRSRSFATYEEPIDLIPAIERAFDTHQITMVECVPTWLGNIYFHAASQEVPNYLKTLTDYVEHHWANNEQTPAETAVVQARCFLSGAMPRSSPLDRVVADAKQVLIVVTNETGLGIVPAEAANRSYRDDLGRLNQRLAASAAAFFFCVAGIARQIK